MFHIFHVGDHLTFVPLSHQACLRTSFHILKSFEKGTKFHWLSMSPEKRMSLTPIPSFSEGTVIKVWVSENIISSKIRPSYERCITYWKIILTPKPTLTPAVNILHSALIQSSQMTLSSLWTTEKETPMGSKQLEGYHFDKIDAGREEEKQNDTRAVRYIREFAGRFFPQIQPPEMHN